MTEPKSRLRRVPIGRWNVRGKLYVTKTDLTPALRRRWARLDQEHEERQAKMGIPEHERSLLTWSGTRYVRRG